MHPYVISVSDGEVYNRAVYICIRMTVAFSESSVAMMAELVGVQLSTSEQFDG